MSQKRFDWIVISSFFPKINTWSGMEFKFYGPQFLTVILKVEVADVAAISVPVMTIVKS